MTWMNAKILGLVLFAVGLFWGEAVKADMAEKALGVWRTKSGAHVQMYKCGADLCGKFVHLPQKDARDEKNPNPALRNRPLMGLTFFQAKKSGTDRWSGKLYNVRDGKTYTGSLTVLSSDKVKLSGCVLGIFCKSQTWPRVK